MKTDLHIRSFMKCLSAIFLCSCLTFLTGVNFIIYPPLQKTNVVNQDQQFPLEEKSPSASLSVQEEYLHHENCVPFVYLSSNNIDYNLHRNEELPVVHFELISPPPDLSVI